MRNLPSFILTVFLGALLVGVAAEEARQRVYKPPVRRNLFNPDPELRPNARPDKVEDFLALPNAGARAPMNPLQPDTGMLQGEDEQEDEDELNDARNRRDRIEDFLNPEQHPVDALRESKLAELEGPLDQPIPSPLDPLKDPVGQPEEKSLLDRLLNPEDPLETRSELAEPERKGPGDEPSRPGTDEELDSLRTSRAAANLSVRDLERGLGATSDLSTSPGGASSEGVFSEATSGSLVDSLVRRNRERLMDSFAGGPKSREEAQPRYEQGNRPEEPNRFRRALNQTESVSNWRDGLRLAPVLDPRESFRGPANGTRSTLNFYANRGQPNSLAGNSFPSVRLPTDMRAMPESRIGILRIGGNPDPRRGAGPRLQNQGDPGLRPGFRQKDYLRSGFDREFIRKPGGF